MQATLKHFAGVLRLPRRAQHGAGGHGPAGVRRRHPAAVRDGHPARRRPLGDAVLHRHRRRARERRPRAARRAAARRSSASTAWSSPTTTRSPSWSSSTRSPATPAGAAALALRRGRRRGAAHRALLRATRCARPSEAETSPWSSWTGPSPGCCGRSASWACSTPAGPRCRSTAAEARIDLDPPAQPRAGPPPGRGVRRPAGQRGGALPLPPGAARRVAVDRPAGRRPAGVLRLLHHAPPPGGTAPRPAAGVEVATVLGRAARGAARRECTRRGCDVRTADRTGFAAAVAAARAADMIVAVRRRRGRAVRPRHLGRGLRRRPTCGCPACRKTCCSALADTGTPVVAVLVTGPPVRDRRAWPAGWPPIVQAFFPGEEGGPAIAGVLSGRVAPSGRLPVELPRRRGGAAVVLPAVPAARPAPAAARWTRRRCSPSGTGCRTPRSATRTWCMSAAEIADRRRWRRSPARCATPATAAGAEVVQLYLSDPVAQVVRPVRWLAGFARVPLAPGQARRVDLPAARRPDRVHRPGRRPDRRAGRDHGRRRRGVGPACRCTARSRSAARARGGGRPDPRYARDGS